jgi:hypothetical protein
MNGILGVTDLGAIKQPNLHGYSSCQCDPMLGSEAVRRYPGYRELPGVEGITKEGGSVGQWGLCRGLSQG